MYSKTPSKSLTNLFKCLDPLRTRCTRPSQDKEHLFRPSISERNGQSNLFRDPTTRDVTGGVEANFFDPVADEIK